LGTRGSSVTRTMKLTLLTATALRHSVLPAVCVSVPILRARTGPAKKPHYPWFEQRRREALKETAAYRKKFIKELEQEEEQRREAEDLLRLQLLEEQQRQKRQRVQLAKEKARRHEIRCRLLAERKAEKKAGAQKKRQEYAERLQLAKEEALEALMDDEHLWTYHPDEMRNRRYMISGAKEYYTKYN